MGRKPIKDKPMQHMMRIRMTTEDRAAINRAAELDGVADSEWARRVLIAAANRRIKREKK